MSKINLNILIGLWVLMMALTGPVVARTIYVDPNGSADFTSINAAINDPCTVDGDEIEVAPATYYEAINFNGKAVHLYSSDGPTLTIIDGKKNVHVVLCYGGEDANTIIEGFYITGGNADGTGEFGDGGGMYNHGASPTVIDCIFANNQASHGGGGMANCMRSSPTVINCTFLVNSANEKGGGMYNDYNSNPMVTHCTFSNNSASDGGGIYNEDSNPTVKDCNFCDNEATRGGGMYNYSNSSPNVVNCIFADNSAASAGGGMYNTGSSPTVTNCNFSRNMGDAHGGGMYNTGSSPMVSECTFKDNQATYSGGGMANSVRSSPTVINCTFSGNMVRDDGGGMYNDYKSNPTVSGCTFSFNVAWYGRGGGMFNYPHSSPIVINCTFNDNSALYGFGGGGMYNEDASPTVTSCTFKYNTTTKNGGGMFNQGGSPAAINCTFSGNWARQGWGGGIFNDSSSPTVSECTFSYNAAKYGGGIFNNKDSSPMVTNCTFNRNESVMSGGGMYNRYDSNPKVSDCTFNYNEAKYGGGIDNEGSSPIVTNCTFSKNSAFYDDGYGGEGGGMSNYDNSSPTVTNCIFKSNWAGKSGAGMYNWNSSNPKLTNCIFEGNRCQYKGGGMFNNSSSPTVSECTFTGNVGGGWPGGGMYNENGSGPTVTNCIFWHDSDEFHDEDSSSTIVSYSDIQFGWLGEGNIDADPCFVERGYWDDNGTRDWYDDFWVGGDYHLLEGSPCINAGNPSYVAEPNETDLDGNPRVVNGRIDMGAYESTFLNTAPVACIVGGDRVVEAGVDCQVQAVLDGSCSSDADSTAGTNDDINDFDWYEVIDVCDPNSDIYIGSGEVIECNLGLGEHLIIIEVTDKAGAFDSNEVVITVEDTTAPLITLNGSDTAVLECGIETYSEEGATATDNCDDGVTVVIGGDAVDTLTCGTYEVTYDATDSWGNEAEQITREVIVEDTTGPVITLNGSEMVVLECGIDSYVEEGATATDNCDDDVAVVIGGDVVDTTVCRMYVVTYDATDDWGNAAEQVVREVIVEDTIPPEFSLSVEPNVLWPPNNKMVLVTPAWEVSDSCDELPEVSLVDVTMSSEGDVNDHV
ncbi:MAG: right-handed parallel beta-helix repeat-containing protein, partial [Planctomycetota bacterium]